MKSEQEINAEKAHKSRPDLIPGSALDAEGEVMGDGFRKHGPCTWKNAGTEQAKPETHIASCMRHLIEILKHGPLARDPETGCLHLAHLRAQSGIAIDCLALHRASLAEPASPFAPGAVEGEDPWKLPRGWEWGVDGGHYAYGGMGSLALHINKSDGDKNLREWSKTFGVSVVELVAVRELVRKRNGWG